MKEGLRNLLGEVLGISYGFLLRSGADELSQRIVSKLTTGNKTH